MTQVQSELADFFREHRKQRTSLWSKMASMLETDINILFLYAYFNLSRSSVSFYQELSKNRENEQRETENSKV